MAKEVYRKAKPSPPNWFWPKKMMDVGTVIAKDMVTEGVNASK